MRRSRLRRSQRDAWSGSERMPTGLAARPESETITVMWGMPADNGGSAITAATRCCYQTSGDRWTV